MADRKVFKGNGFQRTERTFKIILPKFSNEGKPIKASERKEVAKRMSKRFGGATAQSISGFFIGEKGKLEGEENTMISSSRDIQDKTKSKKILQNDRKFMKKLASQSGKKFGQESIFIEEDIIQDVSFISGKRKGKLNKKLLGTDAFRNL